MCRHNACLVQLSEKEKEILVSAIAMCRMLAFEPVAERPPEFVASGPDSPGFCALPGRNSIDYRLGAFPPDTLTDEMEECLSKAYSLMDEVARLVLASLNRSCHVRLRSDLWLPLLDDMPLTRGVRSSSRLVSVQHVNNFTRATATHRQQSLALSQEGYAIKGLLSVMSPTEAQENPDRGGAWLDVKHKVGEVVVMFGHTAARASCGLFQPATYRVVGDAFAGHGRQSLEFQLNARPSAVIDLSDALREAGHTVPEKLGQPVYMKELLQHFDKVLTPVSGPRQSGRQSLEYSTMAVAAARRK
eukprot:jgi/Astpho2/5039/Aster-x0229